MALDQRCYRTFSNYQNLFKVIKFYINVKSRPYSAPFFCRTHTHNFLFSKIYRNNRRSINQSTKKNINESIIIIKNIYPHRKGIGNENMNWPFKKKGLYMD